MLDDEIKLVLLRFYFGVIRLCHWKHQQVSHSLKFTIDFSSQLIKWVSDCELKYILMIFKKKLQF